MKPLGPHLSVVPEPGDDDPELERYLGAARQLAEPDAQSRARVARALNAALPPTAPLPAFGANVASSSSAARAASVARLYAPWLAVGAALIGGLGFWLGASVGRPEPVASTTSASPGSLEASVPTSGPPESVALTPLATPAADDLAPPSLPEPQSAPPVAAAAPRAESHAPTSATTAARPAPRDELVSRTRPRSAGHAALEGASDPRPRSIDFREALDRLRRARQQLQQGHATASLLLLSELDRDAGELLFEERAATRVLALCAAGETPAARAAAEQLAQRSPRSIYLRRLASSCIDESATAFDADATLESGADGLAR